MSGKKGEKMSRYIDAEWLKELYKPYQDFNGKELAVPIGAILANIDDTPSIDIVRCEKCKWRNKYGCHNPKWGDGWANYPPPNPQDDDFCSYGERREDDTEKYICKPFRADRDD